MAVVLDSTRALLGGIVDYAGTFPPAGLTLVDALGEYAGAKAGADAWLLGRLVISLRHLPDFERLAPPAIPAGRGPWELSVVLPPEPTGHFAWLQTFNEQWRGKARVVSVEVPPIGVSRIAVLAETAPTGLEMFFETPLGAGLEARLHAIKAVGAAAKVRTGGVTADVAPAADQLVRFLDEARAVGLAFKATAGLHHAARGCYPLTYEAGSDTGTMHGFLNLAAAAANVHSGGPAHDTLVMLLEPSPLAFEFRPDGLVWRGRTIETDDLATTRRQFFRSFGSCSIREPAEDLRRLQLS